MPSSYAKEQKFKYSKEFLKTITVIHALVLIIVIPDSFFKRGKKCFQAGSMVQFVYKIISKNFQDILGCKVRFPPR